MTTIGLTGGIAAGKSTAAEILREFGATVIDADRLGHRSYEPGTPGFQKVVNAFGHDIVGKDGQIDRRILGGKVFGAPGQLERLNAIVWPEIRTLIQEEIQQIRVQEEHPIIVLEAAVLLEAEWQDLCDEIWVVYTPIKTAVERLKERNGLSEDAAMARINAQMSNKERTAVADVKIENASTEDQLRARVERAWKSLLVRHGKKRGGKATKTGSVKAAAKSGSAKPAARAAATATTRAAAAKAPSKAVTKAVASKPASPKPATAKAAAAKPAVKATSKAVTKAVAKASSKAGGGKAAAKPAASKAAPKATGPKATGSKGGASKGAGSKGTGSKGAGAKATSKASGARTK